MFRLLEATIDDIHAAMRAGEITCRQLVERYVNRIEAYDHKGPALNAIQTLNERAAEEAERLDAAFARSGPVGPLHGIPVLVKDQVETRDLPTTYGSALFRGFQSGRDAAAVERLRAAGAVILAKTTMGEFASGFIGSAFGVCRNPYDPAREPGGSSCGSGVGVAANFGVVAIGEDTFGSIRNPAARNSLVGLRPTVPLVSRFGMMPATPSQDTLGPLARTVRDTALLLDVLAGYDPRDPVTAQCVGQVPPSYTAFLDTASLRGMRLGVIREPLSEDTDPTAADYAQVWAAMDEALRALAAAGAEIVGPVAIPGLRDLLRRSAGSYEAEAAVDAYLAAHPTAPVKSVREIVLSAEVVPSRRARFLEDLGHTTSDQGYLQQLLARAELRQAILTALADHQLQALVYASFDHAPEVIPADILSIPRRIAARGANRALASYLGYPAISVPAGFTPPGLPVGIEFLGRPFAEGTLLQIAYAYEQATHHRRPPTTTPPLLGAP
ncbi:MAG TPA: amidase family protein [Chloroflexota bacterium]|nr:amidase family protein [Chloroflexota bacterium]